ncbi:unnamed protein product [Durusdinium trenchii]|uniref:Uncharacterized protein n=2 Tax=Durusdinium trenchii TaxID=1381693 RepID=A0ABP0JJ82_9DINO
MQHHATTVSMLRILSTTGRYFFQTVSTPHMRSAAQCFPRFACEAALPSSRFQVVQALPWWHNAPKEEHGHGSTLPSWASHCLRSQPDVHRCRGFFLCRLDRTAPEPEEPEEPAQNAAPRKRRKRRRPDRAEKTADVGGRVRPPSEAPKVQAKKSKKGKALGLRIHSAWARLLRTGALDFAVGGAHFRKGQRGSSDRRFPGTFKTQGFPMADPLDMVKALVKLPVKKVTKLWGNSAGPRFPRRAGRTRGVALQPAMEEPKVSEFKSIGGQRTLVAKKRLGQVVKKGREEGSLPSLTGWGAKQDHEREM